MIKEAFEKVRPYDIWKMNFQRSYGLLLCDISYYFSKKSRKLDVCQEHKQTII